MRGAHRPRFDRQVRHRRDRRQRLAAKAKRRDAGQIAVGDFRRRVALDRERQVALVHAASVVDDADEAFAALFDRDVDARRAGVKRVLDELLDGGRRALDHLAGGDAIDEKGIETANGHG